MLTMRGGYRHNLPMSPLKRSPRSRWAAGLFAAAVLCLSLNSVSSPATGNAEVTATGGLVAAAHPLASKAGAEILEAGGNAVDAAVAAAFAIAVAEPNSNGLGGEGMMIVYLARSRKAVAIDYRSTAPAGAVFPGRIPDSGPASVAVPGTVAGLCLALEKYGTLPLSRVLEPAIALAADGFTVSPTLARIILDDFEELSGEEGLAAVFCPDGLPLEAGDTLKNPALAASLRLIAWEGRDAFYRGELAERMAADIGGRGGFLTKADLAAYRAIEREPVRGTYRGYRIISAPPPVGGLAVVEALQILERFDLGRLALLSPERVHLMAEAMKRAMVDWRAFVGDPGFVKVPVAGLLAPAYAERRAAEIRPDRISEKIASGDPAEGLSPSTTSLSVVDQDGNMVALTQTISDFFGAKVMVGGTGIILNNEMGNFSAQGPNSLAPGKRMRTTIAPTIILKGKKPFAAVGTPGAARILTTTPIVVSNLVDYGLGIQAAIEAPRFFPADKELLIEPRLPEATFSALEKLGYTVTRRSEFDLYFGGAQGVVVEPGTKRRIGGADPRRDGAVAGVGKVVPASKRIRIPKVRPAVHDVRPGPGVVTKALSDYLPGLAGTAGETAVYVLEGEAPGGTVFVAGGTHAGEIAGQIAAVGLVERAVVRRGRLVVIPYANNSAITYPDPRRRESPRSFSVRGAGGLRSFKIGARLTGPRHQGEKDPPGEKAPSPEYAVDNLSRNLDRQYPGRADGNLTQRIAWAITSLIVREKADLAFDLHEAPPGSRLAMMIVANPKNVDLAAEAVLSLESVGLSMKLEQSSPEFRGLSHREWGDATPAKAFLFETPDPAFLKDHPGDPVIDPEWPLAKRVAIHLEALRAIVQAWNGGAPESRRVVIEGLPSYDDLAKTGLACLLR
jgi:gamma-glutamyltranspeptidase/glutathione hydrolase